MELLSLGNIIQALFTDSVSAQFYRTLLLFVAAAWVHGRQVRKEIKSQISQLIKVLQQDLNAQKELIAKTDGRVTKIEEHLNIKGEKSDGTDFRKLGH